MSKKILAVILTLVLALSFAACGSKTTDETTTDTTAAETEAEITAEATADEATASDETTEATTEATASDETTTEAETSAEETTKEAAKASETDKEEETTEEALKAPQTKEEIVEYYNKVINEVKPKSKKITQKYQKISLAGPTTLPSALNGVLKLLGGADKFIGDQLAKNSQGEAVLTDKKAFPVEGETWSSKLTAADVKSATCTEKNGVYTITITTIADGKTSNVQHGQGHAPKAFNVILPGVVNDNIPGAAKSLVGTASMNYPSSTVKITVDAKTGHVLTANYDLYWTINFDKAGAILPFLTQSAYVIEW
jgi:hypothetical protein